MRAEPVTPEWFELLGSETTPETLKNRRYHLSKLLPKDLNQLILSVKSRTYRLDLKPESIELLDFDDELKPVAVGLDANLQI